MNYTLEGETHRITMNKDEMLVLVSLVHEGLENLQQKAAANNWVELAKYESGKRFVDDMNRSIMSG